jgi:hypothetical protein
VQVSGRVRRDSILGSSCAKGLNRVALLCLCGLGWVGGKRGV